jgi:hypothetical protein
MNIPKYWAKHEQGVAGPRRKMVLRNWQGSDVSVEDARRKAEARVAEIAGKLARGEELDRYGYADRPLREEIQEAVHNRFRDEVGIVTRNAYGALVLNAEQVMFVDIDIPRMEAPRRKGLFGGKKESSFLDPYLPSIRRVEDWSIRHPEYGIRIYATNAGLRCLVTNTVFDPEGGEAAAILKELDSDPLYSRLCRAQGCFRARLSPKPWRCGLRPPPGELRYPREDPRLEEKFRNWKRGYNAAAGKFAVCLFIKQIGSKTVHPDSEAVREYHDRATLAESGLPLA